MSKLPQIKEELSLMSDMKGIMDTMKSIALINFIEAKNEREKRFEKFVDCFAGFFKVADLAKSDHPLLSTKATKVCIIAITSSESFMATMNARIMKLAEDKSQNQDVHFVLTGPRMMGRVKGSGYEYTLFPPIKLKNMVEVATQIKDFVIKKVLDQEYGKVMAVYAYPHSIAKQEIRAITLIPAEDIYPSDEKIEIADDEEVCIESDFGNMMMYLNEMWLLAQLIYLFQDHRMSEGAAQSMQLDGNLENLADYEKKLKLEFVKTRRDIIDSALRETVTAMMSSPA